MATRLGIVGLEQHRRGARPQGGEAFGLNNAAWWGPREKPEAPWPRLPNLIALAAQSDILVATCKSTPETVGLISRRVIEALGSEGLLVNVSRGQVVDEDAVAEALKSGRLGMETRSVMSSRPSRRRRNAGPTCPTPC